MTFIFSSRTVMILTGGPDIDPGLMESCDSLKMVRHEGDLSIKNQIQAHLSFSNAHQQRSKNHNHLPYDTTP
jgi:hypothetical protein